MTDNPFEQVARRIDPGGRLIRSWTLPGGVSAQITALAIAGADGQTQTVVVRQHGEEDRRNNPQVAAHEFRLMHHLQRAGIAVPAPYDLDESGEIFPFPYLTVEFIDGVTEIAPGDVSACMRQLAACLAAIHRVSITPDLAFLSRNADAYEAPAAADGMDGDQIRAVLEPIWPLPPVNHPVLLHGDFWHGNVLWRDGAIAAVIDWEDAAVGDPFIDLGTGRLEILWAFGADAMLEFTQHYQAQMPAVSFAQMAYWDLFAAIKPIGRLGIWGLDAATEQKFHERHHWFVAQALEALGL